MKTIPTAMILLKDEAEKYGADGDYVIGEIEKYLIENDVNIENIEINKLFEEEIHVTE